MRPRLLRQALALVFCTLFTSITFATDMLPPVTKTAEPLGGQNYFTPPAPTVDAKGFVLLDSGTGKILAQKEPNTRMAPASLTKIMTLYVISQALNNRQIGLDDEVLISAKAQGVSGSRMFVKAGSRVKVRDLIQGIIVASGNDACIAMSEHIAGSEETIVDLMNQQAKQLGMNNTHFTDCTGMPDPNHYSTPLDIAVLSRALITHFPQYYPWYSQKWFTYNNIKQPNRNRLLWRFEYADGIKTGHTEEAGFCLAASAQKDKMRLVSVIMGAPSDSTRADGAQRLLTYGFRFFQARKLYNGGMAISKPRVWKGEMTTVPVGLKQDLSLLVPTGQANRIKAVANLHKPLIAPIAKGDNLGTLDVTLGDQLLIQAPLIALEAMPAGNTWQRVRDTISLRFAKALDDEDEIRPNQH
jgi:serine-type D-Ala-D-Ala carboxypeptidase (penicillin-binding protein 5/6)